VTDGNNTDAPQPPRLRNLGAAPSRRYHAATHERYSAFVRAARLALPVAALVIVGIVIAKLSSDPHQSLNPVATMPKDEKTIPGQTAMTEAKYEGIDQQGRPYTVTAKSAARDMKAPESVLLTAPGATLQVDDSRTVAMQAAAGVFDAKNSQLRLYDGVRVSDNTGYEMDLRDIDIDIKARHAVTQSPVSGKGPLGTLDAAGMDVQDGGAMIVFKGPATMQLRNLSSAGKTLP
jgi:lipopolysaccharide export system protein LptC